MQRRTRSSKYNRFRGGMSFWREMCMIRAKSPCYSFHSSNTLIFNDDSRAHHNDLRLSVAPKNKKKTHCHWCRDLCASEMPCNGKLHENDIWESWWSKTARQLRIRNLTRRIAVRIIASRRRQGSKSISWLCGRRRRRRLVKSGTYRSVHVDWAREVALRRIMSRMHKLFRHRLRWESNDACHRSSSIRRTNSLKKLFARYILILRFSFYYM